MTDLPVEPGFVRVDPRAADRFETARLALSAIPMPVTLIGAGRGADRSCATGTAMYVSFAPPYVAVALHPGSRTAGLVDSLGRFSVSVLSGSQVEVAIGAGRSAGTEDKFHALGIDVVEDHHGTPAAADALVRIWCRVVEARPAGDHVLIIGEVEAFDRSGLDGPRAMRALVRHQRRYGSIDAWLSDPDPTGYPT